MVHEFQQSGFLFVSQRTGSHSAGIHVPFTNCFAVGGSVWYMIWNLRCTDTIDSVLANSKTQNAFLFTVKAIFLHDYPIAVEPWITPRPLVQKKTWRNSLPIDMLLSAVSVLVVAQSSSKIPDGLMNNPVFLWHWTKTLRKKQIRNNLKVLKRSIGEGWRRSIGPIVWKMRKYYKESKKKWISYIQ